MAGLKLARGLLVPIALLVGLAECGSPHFLSGSITFESSPDMNECVRSLAIQNTVCERRVPQRPEYQIEEVFFFDSGTQLRVFCERTRCRVVWVWLGSARPPDSAIEQTMRDVRTAADALSTSCGLARTAIQCEPQQNAFGRCP